MVPFPCLYSRDFLVHRAPCRVYKAADRLRGTMAGLSRLAHLSLKKPGKAGTEGDPSWDQTPPLPVRQTWLLRGCIGAETRRPRGLACGDVSEQSAALERLGLQRGTWELLLLLLLLWRPEAATM